MRFIEIGMGTMNDQTRPFEGTLKCPRRGKPDEAEPLQWSQCFMYSASGSWGTGGVIKTVQWRNAVEKLKGLGGGVRLGRMGQF